MAAVVFDDILLQGVRAGQIPAKTRKARTWYRMKAKELGTKTTQTSLVSDSERLRGRILPGTMVFYVYDAKGKKTLPYYDRFPLTIVVEKTSDGFLGLNLHYLPYQARAKLMDALYTLSNNKKYDDTTRLKLTYQTLKGAAKLAAFKPCLKRYLSGQVRSKYVYINPSEWDIALFLPVENFKGAGKRKVWTDSASKY
jgi:hypothetical protein